MAVEDIKELKGYNKPSVYKGQKADRLISELGIGTVEDFNKLAREQGLGSFGKDKEATKFLNQLLTKAGKPNYSTVAPIQRAVEIELFGNDPKNTKMDRMVFSTRMEKISNAVQSMKKPLKEKIQYIGNMIKNYYPNISPKSVQSMIRLFSMALGPNMIGADIMSEEANKEAMSKIFGGTQSYAGGGIASMDDMIRPIGMAGGGDFRESLSAMIAKLDSEIVSLRLDQMYMGDDNEKAIQSKQNQLNYFKDQMRILENK